MKQKTLPSRSSRVGTSLGNKLNMNKTDIYFLNENYIIEANNLMQLRNDQLDAVLFDLRIVNSNKDLIELALNWSVYIFSEKDIFKQLPLSKLSIPKSAPLLPVMVLLSGLDDLKSFYKKNNIPDKVLTDTLYDVGRVMDECYARNNRYVIEPAIFEWLNMHFTGRLFHLCRLQFEAIKFYEDNDYLKKGDYVINVHIPAGDKMLHDDVAESYRQAVVFFRKLLPEYNFKYFICESWMLSPQLSDILDQSSNLIKFFNDYELYGTGENDGFFDNIFVKKPTDLNTLPEKTTLQRAIKNLLLSGEKFISGRGCNLIDKWV